MLSRNKSRSSARTARCPDEKRNASLGGGITAVGTEQPAAHAGKNKEHRSAPRHRGSGACKEYFGKDIGAGVQVQELWARRAKVGQKAACERGSACTAALTSGNSEYARGAELLTAHAGARARKCPVLSCGLGTALSALQVQELNPREAHGARRRRVKGRRGRITAHQLFRARPP
jgi:hypothetical protein